MIIFEKINQRLAMGGRMKTEGGNGWAEEASGKKLIFSLFVLDFIVLKHLADSSG